MKLSFILPCYNIEKFIVPCLDSIYNQGLDDKEFEVICVNDCSPDRTKEVVLEYQKTHSNLILIDHEKNKRVGAARNTGFYAAQGEYVWFIDPDDLVVKGAVSKLLPILDKDNLDFIQFGHSWMTEDCKPIINPPYNHNCPFDTEVISGVEFIKEYLKRSMSYANMHVGCFVRIYRRSYLANNNIIFPEVVYFEDQYQALHGLLAAARMRNVAHDYYQYRVLTNSYSHAPLDIKKRTSRLVMCCDMYSLCQRFKIDATLVSDIMSKYTATWRYIKTHNIDLLPTDDRHYFVSQMSDRLAILWLLIKPKKWLLCKWPKIYLFLTDILHKPLLLSKNVVNEFRKTFNHNS